MLDDTPLEMDAIAAHLDRGWERLHLGDLEAARLSARHILQLNPESAEGHTLLGAVAASAGDAEEALEWFRRAMDLDPDYLHAYLYAAEFSVHVLTDYAYALQLCDEATSIAVDDEEKLDIGLLRAEALLGMGELEEARRVAEELPPPPYPMPGHYLRAGRILLETGQIERALTLLPQSLDHPDTRADAHYYMGVALEQSQRSAEGLEHFFKSLELEQHLPASPSSLSSEEFEHLMQEVVGQLSSVAAERIHGVPIKVRDLPAAEAVAEGFDPRGVIFLCGLPAAFTEPSALAARLGSRAEDEEPSARLFCIFIYQRNVERLIPLTENLRGELRTLLEQEVESFFSVEEESLGPDARH